MRRRHIPPFAAVRAFEATARTRNMRLAAEELGLTPSAVSHQIRALEQYLGQSLFVRGPGGLALTAAGQRYCEGASQVLDQLEAAGRAVMQPPGANALRISCYISLTQSWLLPRLRSFRQAYPAIELRIMSYIDPFEVDFGDVDLIIGVPPDPANGQRCDLLAEEEIFPVCSPELSATLDPARPEALLRHPLIVCYGNEADWPLWGQVAGLATPLPAPALLFETQALLQQAAAEGLGIALARRPFVDADLAAGRLLRPFPVSYRSGKNYCLIANPRQAENGPAAAFRAWLLGALGRMP